MVSNQHVSIASLILLWSLRLRKKGLFTVLFEKVNWCKESWHCALMHSILHRVLSWLRYCCISMLHPSNRPWHCAHDSSSCLTQGVAPLFPSLGGESASCPVSLRSWVAHQHLSWSPCVVPTRLAQCALLVSEALHQGPLVWPCPSHHASP